jgi:hypothetical protein
MAHACKDEKKREHVRTKEKKSKVDKKDDMLEESRTYWALAR